MNKKLKVLVILILTAAAIYLMYNFNNSEVLVKELEADQIIIDSKMGNVDSNNNLIDNKPPVVSIPIEAEEINQQTHQFHEDSVLDYRIAVGKLNNCINYFNPVKSFGAFKVTKQELTTKQKTQSDKFHQYCESIKDEFPYYFSQDMLTGLLNSDPNLKALSGFDKFSEQKLFNVIKNFQNKNLKPTEADVFDIGSTNAYSIIGAQESLKSLFEEKVYPDLSDIIGGNDKQYLKNIVNHSENKIACDLGADCGVNSNIMMNYCRKNESNCGLSFKQMYETRLSRGQQLDILAVEVYLSGLFAL